MSQRISIPFAASPSAKNISTGDIKLQNDIKNAFEAFDFRAENEKRSRSPVEYEYFNSAQEKLKTLQTRIGKKTLLQTSSRQKNLGAFRQQKSSGENIESVFAKRSIDRLIKAKPSIDSTSSQQISQRTITPS